MESFFLFFLCFCCCCLTADFAAVACPLTLSPAHVVVRYEGPLRAVCAASVARPEGLGWESVYGGTGLVEGATSLPLNISSVDSWEVEPICFLNQQGGAQCVRTLNVTVYKPPDSVSVAGAALAGPLLAGRALRLSCRAAEVAPARNLQLVWRTTAGVLETQTFAERAGAAPVNLTSELELRPDGRLDGQQLWCEAQLSFGAAGPRLPSVSSEPHNVTVLYPPVFLVPGNETLTVEESQRLRLDCSAKGNPAPRYGWLLPHTEREEVRGPVLEPAVTKAGTYICSASNTQGTSTKHFTVSHQPRGRTMLAAMLAAFLLAGVVTAVVGLKLLKPDGFFSCNKGTYQPAATGTPI